MRETYFFKKLLPGIFVIIFITGASAIVAHAQDAEGQKEVSLGLAQQIGNFYAWALGIGGLVALGVLIFGGILYTASAGNASRQEDAKQWVTGAFVGLILLFGSYFILNTINPELTKLTDLKLLANKAAESVGGGDDPGFSGSSSVGAERVAEIALAEYNAGVQEVSLGSNTGPRVRQYLDTVSAGPVNPWCAAFTSWVFQQAGYPLSCASAAAKDLLNCGPAATAPAVGQIAVFRTDDSDFNNDHAGIVTEVLSDGKYVVISGNSCDEKGCDRVARKVVDPNSEQPIKLVSVPEISQ